MKGHGRLRERDTALQHNNTRVHRRDKVAPSHSRRIRNSQWRLSSEFRDSHGMHCVRCCNRGSVRSVRKSCDNCSDSRSWKFEVYGGAAYVEAKALQLITLAAVKENLVVAQDLKSHGIQSRLFQVESVTKPFASSQTSKSATTDRHIKRQAPLQ